MTIFSKTAIIIIAIFSFLSAPLYGQDHFEADPNARDILILTDWFEGEFDNEEQLWYQNDPRSSTREDQRTTRVHSINKRVHLPEFGKHVFYAEEYSDNDPTKIIRQRFVIFSSDVERKEIRMQQGFFKDPIKVLGAHEDVSKLEGITSDDLFFLNECDVYWNRKAGQFEGKMDDKACVFGDGEDRRYSVHNLTLSENKFWRVDETYRVSDNSLFSEAPVPGRPIKMRRSKIYMCNALFRSLDMMQQVATEPQKIHSQGGMIHITRPSDGKEFSIRIREKEYPYYDTRPDFLFLSVLKKGENRSLVYAVGDANSRNLAVYLPGEFTMNCVLDGYEFRETFESLR